MMLKCCQPPRQNKHTRDLSCSRNSPGHLFLIWWNSTLSNNLYVEANILIIYWVNDTFVWLNVTCYSSAILKALSPINVRIGWYHNFSTFQGANYTPVTSITVLCLNSSTLIYLWYHYKNRLVKWTHTDTCLQLCQRYLSRFHLWVHRASNNFTQQKMKGIRSLFFVSYLY